MITKESTGFNRKLFLNVFMLIWLVTIYVLRGDGKTESIVGVTKCETIDHVLAVGVMVGAVFFMLIGACLNRQEQRIKEELGYTFTTGDIDW